MPYGVFNLKEFSSASRFFRAISEIEAQGTGILTIGARLLELKLTASNLRQLLALPQEELAYINGIACLTTYNVWLAGPEVNPIYIGSFDVPAFGRGEFYASFAHNNIHYTGHSITECTWLLVTAGDKQTLGVWNEDAAAAILFTRIMPLKENNEAAQSVLWELFVTQSDANKDRYEDDDAFFAFDEDEDQVIEEE